MLKLFTYLEYFLMNHSFYFRFCCDLGDGNLGLKGIAIIYFLIFIFIQNSLAFSLGKPN